MTILNPAIFNPATGLAQGSFGIGTYAAKDGPPFPAVVTPAGLVYDISSLYRDTHAVFDDWDAAFDRLHSIANNGGLPEYIFSEVRKLPALAHPNMLCAGANYRQHVAEMMTLNKFNQHNRLEGENDEDFFKRNYAEIDRRSREGMPYFWTGLHSSLTGANDDVALPLIGENHDWELEFGAILCGTGRYLRPEETNDIVAGYVMVNDYGTVDEFRRTDVRWGFDWVSKHQPGFKPFGPFIVPKQFVDLSNVRIKLSVNDAVKQDWPISDMIFPVEKLLSYASERVRLMPGDLLITGSPPGNGASHGQFLQAGDIVKSEISYLGHQENHILAEDAGNRQPVFGRFPT